MRQDAPFSWSNPHGIDLSKPYLYFIRVRNGKTEYRYVGKGSDLSRMDAYANNVGRVLSGQTKRPPVKRDGQPQSGGNIKFRYVHLVLAVAARHGWEIEHYPLENCTKEHHTALERLRRRELACNMNGGASWFVEDFDKLAKALVAG
jgi:hypothetical protein